MIRAFTTPLADSNRLVAVSAHFISGDLSSVPSGALLPPPELATLLIRDAQTDVPVTPTRPQLDDLCRQALAAAGFLPSPTSVSP